MHTPVPNSSAIAQAQAYLQSQGVTLNPHQLMEVTARLNGYADYATMETACVPADDDLTRVCLQYEVATSEPSAVARDRVNEIGLAAAMAEWRNDRELVISLGDHIVRAESEQGFWNEHFGWVFDKGAATGYSADRNDDWASLAPDAELVKYSTAVSFEPSEHTRPA